MADTHKYLSSKSTKYKYPVNGHINIEDKADVHIELKRTLQ